MTLLATYSSGRPRVHSGPMADIVAAIVEYERFDGDPILAADLRDAAADMREEMAWRARETA